jgi:hypothetical protein
MSEFLPTYTYGVDVAMWKLRPGAVYQLEGTNFTQWEDPTGKEPPTWAEVMAQIEEDEAIAKAIEAEHKANHEGVAFAVAAAAEENPLPPPMPEEDHQYHPTGLENAPPQALAKPSEFGPTV